MKLSFHGAAGEVTGSNHLLESGDTKILIDCGLFQGGKFAEEKNFEEFLYDPRHISAVVITHAHLDHIGRLPLLYKKGFRGNIICTPPTKDLMTIALQDSQEILEAEARDTGHDALYLADDIEPLQTLFSLVDYQTPIKIGPFTIQLFDAGHILGSAMAQVKADNTTIVFSGDLGNMEAPLFNAPTTFNDADYIIMESVYGDRLHSKEKNRKDALEDVVEDTVKRGGVLMIPAFALERTQEILYDMDSLVSEGRIPNVPAFVDSPLAIKATEIYKKYPHYYTAMVQGQLKEGKNIFQFPGLKFTQSVDQSKQINEVAPPKIIIAGSGMSQGGRILHHERRYLPDPKSTLLIVGYQTQGSRGRDLLRGATSTRMFGETISVRCQVTSIDGYSAHADQKGLMDWVRPLKDKVKQIFLVHGEPEACQALAYELEDFLGTDVVIPQRGQEYALQ